jgi:hypothetical protein
MASHADFGEVTTRLWEQLREESMKAMGESES